MYRNARKRTKLEITASSFVADYFVVEDLSILKISLVPHTLTRKKTIVKEFLTFSA